jgi:DMSO reductase anchor subunit
VSDVRTYHGQPVLKEPIWSWEIPCYFFSGGVAGASAGLAYLSELRGNQALSRRAWTLATAGVVVSPALLISDLGRPARFLNMLRMFKPTSPMSVGSWILSVSGASTTLAALNAHTGLFPRSAKLAKPAAALFGLPLASYTAALVANTSVPVWHEARTTLPFMFVSGAALSAGAGAVAITPPEHAGPARRLVLAAAVCEGVSDELMRKALGDAAQPYKSGAASHLRRVSRACASVGWVLLARRGGSSRPAAVPAGVLMLASALCRRLSVFKAGVEGAADPKYVVGPQRERIERRETRGGARSDARVRQADPTVGSPAVG